MLSSRKCKTLGILSNIFRPYFASNLIFMSDAPKSRLPHIPLPRKDYRTFTQLLQKQGEPAKRRFTARELMSKLNVTYDSIVSREENPSLLTLSDVFRLAEMLEEPVETLLGNLILEIEHLPKELHPLTEVPNEVKKARRPGRPNRARVKAAVPQGAEPVSSKRPAATE